MGASLVSRFFVNIRGCNGSGKSTIPMSMCDDPEKYELNKPYTNSKTGKTKQLTIATVFPTYGWVALGNYRTKCGGLDSLPTNKVKFKALEFVIKNYPEFNILMEGVIDSTIKSTYIKLLKATQECHPDLKVVALFLTTPLEVCLKRIYKRNGGKSIKEDLVESKHKGINGQIPLFKQEGISVLKFDTSRCKRKSLVLPIFLSKLRRLEDAITKK